MQNFTVETHGCDITAPDQFVNVTLPPQGVYIKDKAHEVERSLIIQALDRTDQCRARAATLLKINRTTLVEKMKRLGIT